MTTLYVVNNQWPKVDALYRRIEQIYLRLFVSVIALPNLVATVLALPSSSSIINPHGRDR